MKKPKRLRGQLPKAYLRADPNLDQHPDPGAMVVLMCEANRQAERGRFKTLDRLRGVLGKARLHACLLRGDLRELDPGLWLLVGWDEWQEGDFTVGERMARLRKRKKRGAVTKLRSAPYQDRNSPSEALRRQGVKAAKANSRDTNPGAGGRAGELQQQPAAASPPGGAVSTSNGHGPIRYDPADPLQVRIAQRCAELADLVATNEGRTRTDADVLEVLRAVSSTPGGKSLDSLTGASPRWLEQTLRACVAFEADHTDPSPAPEGEGAPPVPPAHWRRPQ